MQWTQNGGMHVWGEFQLKCAQKIFGPNSGHGVAKTKRTPGFARAGRTELGPGPSEAEGQKTGGGVKTTAGRGERLERQAVTLSEQGDMGN